MKTLKYLIACAVFGLATNVLGSDLKNLEFKTCHVEKNQCLVVKTEKGTQSGLRPSVFVAKKGDVRIVGENNQVVQEWKQVRVNVDLNVEQVVVVQKENEKIIETLINLQSWEITKFN